MDAPIQAQVNTAPQVQRYNPEQYHNAYPQTQNNPYAQQQPHGGFADPSTGAYPSAPPPPHYQQQQPTNPYL